MVFFGPRRPHHPHLLRLSSSVRHFWQVLYTLCIVTETSWKISDIGSDNFQMISVIFHMMFGK